MTEFCSYPGSTFEEEVTELHTGGEEHDTGGVCVVCDEIYLYHDMKTEFVGVETDGHQMHSWCVLPNCDEEYFGPNIKCTDILGHDQGGICADCKQQRVVHKATNEEVGYDNITSLYHIPIYKCIVAGCDKEIRGKYVKHTVTNFVDNENGTHGTKCLYCSYIITEEHDFEGESELGASPYGISLVAEDIGVSCKECGALASAADNGCSHNYIDMNNETQHWRECTKCGYYEKGSLKSHDYGEYTYNEDGTHSSTCTGCEYKLTKPHYYEDGECIECKVAVSQECVHEYVLKGGETSHWVICSKCSRMVLETTENHKVEKYINNNNGTHTGICKLCKY